MDLYKYSYQNTQIFRLNEYILICILVKFCALNMCEFVQNLYFEYLWYSYSWWKMIFITHWLRSNYTRSLCIYSTLVLILFSCDQQLKLVTMSLHSSICPSICNSFLSSGKELLGVSLSVGQSVRLSVCGKFWHFLTLRFCE